MEFEAGQQVRIASLDTTGVVAARVGLMWRVIVPEGPPVTVSAIDLEVIQTEATDAVRSGIVGDGSAYLARLGIALVRHAYRFDPRSGLSNARIEPTLHQIYVAHRVVHKPQPRMVLADEVGLGKTIEAGLVLKELTARGLAERVLIVVPASLQVQWQHELSSKFNEEFTILDGPALKTAGQGNTNPWIRYPKVITSLQLVSRQQYHDQIIESPWDLVVFDEAHRVRRWLSGNEIRSTKAYELAVRLRDEVFGLLLLSATPMQLHQFELFSLIELIEPGLFVDYAEFDQNRGTIRHLNEIIRDLRTWEALSTAQRSDLGHRLATMLDSTDLELDQRAGRLDAESQLAERHPWAHAMVRNRKKEVGGFTSRRAHTTLVQLTEPEQALYEEISAYVREGYRRAKGTPNQARGFLMVTYHQMLASSSNALYHAFKRRISKLEKRLAAAHAATTPEGQLDMDLLSDLAEDSEALAIIEEIASDPGSALLEIEELGSLCARLAQTRDSKAAAFMELATGLLQDGDKLLIFTRFLETQDFLRRMLETAGFDVAIFNGTLKLDQKEQEVRRFRTTAQVMVTTEAGGEGRNFQFCHQMVNYDLPWNPMRVEQRIGRLDRMGQRRDVNVYTLAAAGTVEERILEVLHQRIRVFEESVGSLDPILGGIEEEIIRIVLEADDTAAEFDRLSDETDRRIRQAKASEDLLADFAMDTTSLRRDEANAILAATPMADHHYLRGVTSRVLEYTGGLLQDDPNGGDWIQLSQRLATEVNGPTATRGTFDPGEALRNEDWPFFTVDQPLVTRLFDRASSTTTPICGVRRDPKLALEVGVEVFWQAIWTPPAGLPFVPWGRLLHHLVDDELSVEETVVEQLPDLGQPDWESVPGWAAQAIDASEQHVYQRFAALEEEARSHLEEGRAQRLQRLERIHRSRLTQVQSLIDNWTTRIANMEEGGSPEQRRILPLWSANRDRELGKLDALQIAYEHDRSRLEAAVFNLALRPIAAGIVVGGA